MLIFVDSSGKALITKSPYASLSSFSLPELDLEMNAIVLSAVVSPKPLFQLQGTLSGTNHINVFGEDPIQVEIRGWFIGDSCSATENSQSLQSALGRGLQFFNENGIVNRASPLTYTISGQAPRRAFLVGIVCSQDSEYMDAAQFQMTLIADSFFQRERPPSPALISNLRISDV